MNLLNFCAFLPVLLLSEIETNFITLYVCSWFQTTSHFLYCWWVLRDSFCAKASRAFFFNCVFPENIHTPTTEGISYRTPPPLRIFHFGVAVVAPPPLWNFQRIFYHPLYPLEIYFFLVANNKQEGRVILSRVYSRDGVHAQGKRR